VLSLSAVLQVLLLTRLNLGPGGDYDNSDTYVSGDGGEPMAGDHYGEIVASDLDVNCRSFDKFDYSGVAGTEPPSYIGGWFPQTGARLNS
jgi:hypothetical protein